MRLAGALSAIDFTDLDNFADGFPHHLFAIHRREAPVFWHEPTEHTPDGVGFWSVAGFGDIAVVAPVEWARSNRHTGIRHLVVELCGDR